MLKTGGPGKTAPPDTAGVGQDLRHNEALNAEQDYPIERHLALVPGPFVVLASPGGSSNGVSDKRFLTCCSYG